MSLEEAEIFSVYVPIYQTMYKSSAEECDLLRTKKVSTDLLQVGPISSGAIQQDDYVVKAEACTETTEALGHGLKKIPLGGLQNPSLQSQPTKKGGTIPGGVHRMRGPSGNILPWPEMVEVVGT